MLSPNVWSHKNSIQIFSSNKVLFHHIQHMCSFNAFGLADVHLDQHNTKICLEELTQCLKCSTTYPNPSLNIYLQGQEGLHWKWLNI